MDNYDPIAHELREINQTLRFIAVVLALLMGFVWVKFFF